MIVAPFKARALALGNGERLFPVSSVRELVVGTPDPRALFICGAQFSPKPRRPTSVGIDTNQNAGWAAAPEVRAHP